MRGSLLAVALTGVSTPQELPAQSAGDDKARKAVAEETLYRPTEIQIDIFGSGDFYHAAYGGFANGFARAGGETRQFSGRPGWGAGAAASFFFFRYFGVGIEQGAVARDAGAVLDADFGYLRWMTAGNFFLRYPVETLRVAPYLMVGGGAFYSTTPDSTVWIGRSHRLRYRLAGQGFGHVGGGIDYRLTRHAAVFSDLRYLFSAVDGLPESQMLWRFGLRFAF